MINEAKQMPQAVEAENAVIGALMLDSRSFTEIESIVAIDDFYLEKNRILFETISNINRNRGVVDMITVMQELIRVGKLDDIGGAFAISELSTMVSSSNHIKYHAQIVKDKSIARRIITLTSLVQDKAFEQTGDISETVEFLEKSITEVNTNTSEISSITLADAIKKSTDKAAEIQSLREKGIDVSIKTGLTELNREFNGGFRAPDLIIIGGRPSMGKALPMNAKVLTPKGFVLNKDLKIGDSVASIDGKRSIVTGIYPQGVIKTYEIEFSDGRKRECCGEHLWEVNSNEFIDKSKVLTTLQIKSILNDKSFKGKLDIPLFCGEYGVDKSDACALYATVNWNRESRLNTVRLIVGNYLKINKFGQISFFTTSEIFGRYIQNLFWSLGYICYMKKVNLEYRMSVYSKNQEELFDDENTKALVRNAKPNRLLIVSVKEKSFTECQCISVSHERALYITDDYIVTHNTQFALHFAKYAAYSRKQVLFISIEMTASQLADRLLLEDDRISMYNLRTGNLSNDEWGYLDKRAGELYNLNINIADNHNIRYINNIKSEARRMKRKDKLDIMFIDYLGLIRTNMKFGTRDLEIGYITGELKNLAKELNIPIVLLSQLSRPPKGISVKEPQLEDLRESGNIEQDADVVMFIHRPSYYDPTITNSLGESWDNKGKLIISKYREGARNRDIIFKHDDAFKKIFDDDDNSKPIIPENFKRVNYSEPDAPLPF